MRRLELRIPPMLVAAALAIAMWGAAVAWPAARFAMAGRRFLAIAVGIAGIAVALYAVVVFRRARTTVNPLHPDDTASLVRSGPYRYSRNPMYVGFLLVLVGWALWLCSAIAFLALPAFVVWMSRFQIIPEERALKASFGEDFEEYRNRVRRWL